MKEMITKMEDPLFAEWFYRRPAQIQQMVRDHPYGKYRIKAGAPYGITCPGTTVYLESWCESGKVGVIVRAKDKKPYAIIHELYLCDKYGRDPASILKKDTKCTVDPKWLEPIE